MDMLIALADWILSTSFHQTVIQSPWMFIAAETVHFMALTLLFGALLLIDMRGLGFFKVIGFETIHSFVPVALFAFVFNLLSGLIFIFTDPMTYFVNGAFQLKMLLIILAGLNALAFEFVVFRPYREGSTAVADMAVTKLMSALSIVFWTLIIILGRLLPYVDSAGGG